jgi:hypothetical protein
MIKRIYVEADNLNPLIDWLKTKPEGQLKVLVGGIEDANAAPLLMSVFQKQGRAFGQWALAKMMAKELTVHSTKDKPTDLEVGLVVESEE